MYWTQLPDTPAIVKGTLKIEDNFFIRANKTLLEPESNGSEEIKEQCFET
jgi:hypothetical protein